MADSPVAEPVESSEPDRTRQWIGAALAALVVLLLIWWFLHFVGIVPATIGMSRARSVDLIGDAGFRTSVTTVTAGERMAGIVVEQTPAQGPYLTWWPVRVVVTAGDGGSTEATSTPASLGEFDLELGSDSLASAFPVDAEEVLPLFVPVSSERIMPNVQNMTQAEAVAAIRRVGLGVGTREGASTTQVRQGRVLYQTPPPGALVSVGQQATVWVSTGVLDRRGNWYYDHIGNRPPGKVYLGP